VCRPLLGVLVLQCVRLFFLETVTAPTYCLSLHDALPISGAPKIAAGLKVPVETVEAWVEADKQRYPGVEGWYVGLEKGIKASRKPTAKFVMHPDIPGLNVQLGRGHYQSPTGKLYTWTELPSPGWQAKKGILATFM